MKEQVTVIFDIGKTNKKFFLFNRHLEEIHEEYVGIPEIKDDDGFPCDDLQAIESWMRERYAWVLDHSRYAVEAVNVSAYGASLVHLDRAGKPATPFYNYTKPFPEALLHEFDEQYNATGAWPTQTASPPLGMLNSGLQLYYLKYRKPELFREIATTLHFPQYLAYLLSGKCVSEYTSLGCHTGLWDFEQKAYHRWVYAEQLEPLFPARVPTYAASLCGNVKVGTGIHDSSSALLPYLQKSEVPFVLISTGTWCICLNPFNHEPLTPEELENDCLNFMQVNGNPVRASRLFMGNEYNLQTRKIALHFGKEQAYHKKVKYNAQLLESNTQTNVFVWESLGNASRSGANSTDLSRFSSYEAACHQLMHELMNVQVQKLRLALGGTSVKRIYVDGGFADNELYIRMLGQAMPGFDIIPTRTPLGSAWGAALVMSQAFHLNQPEVSSQKPPSYRRI